MIEYKMQELTREEDAKKVTEFLLSDNAFNDDILTPGEIEEILINPKKSLNSDDIQYWFAKNKEGEVIAVDSVKENGQKTRGYIGDYCAVHKEYRRYGIALEMHKTMINFLKSKNARFIIIETCATEIYNPMRRLLEKIGFVFIGNYPDYYVEGEGLMTYYKKIEK